MTWIADAGFWIAVVLTGLAAGLLATRWNDRGAPSRGVEGLLLATAAAGVIAWCSNAGVLLGGFASSSEWLAAFVPIDIGAAYRLSVLWATLPGAALTFAVALLTWTALSGPGSRVACLTSGLALAALGLSAWFAPRGTDATTIPSFVQSASAALAPLFALLAVVVLGFVAASAVAARGPAPRALLLVAWLAATAAVVSEQAARSQLGIGPRDAVVLGSASSGLILWLVTSALLHRRVQSLLFAVRQSAAAATDRRARYAALSGHVGAALLAISFAAHAFASRSTIVLPPGTSVSVPDAFRQPWQLVNQGVSRFDASGVDVTALAVEARRPRDGIELLIPEIREYHSRGGQHLAPVSLRRSTGTTTQAIRVLFVGADSLDVASVRVTFLPVPMLWPAGVALLVLAAVFALLASSSNNPTDDLTT
jgi:hypothetical protein